MVLYIVQKYKYVCIGFGFRKSVLSSKYTNRMFFSFVFPFCLIYLFCL